MPDLGSVFNIDLTGFVPILILVALAGLIIAGLLISALLRSRVLAALVFAAVIIYSGTTIVGGVNALTGLVAVTFGGLIVLAIVLARSPELLATVRDVLTRPQPLKQSDPIRLTATFKAPAVPKQLSAPVPPKQLAETKKKAVVKIPRGMGFD
jgi:hypothetical protein